ncbi:MAG TPA: uracil-DNA glycosylase [Ramlibacter sp.]|uniref:uracil-DNA glycosylase n=1 Tax=Ramlibacter sp. TaxID=1917967 RepID=UPI002ED46438
MSLQLDARQRAILQEIGVRVFWPEAPVEEAFVEAAPTLQPRPAAAPQAAPAPQPRPVPAPASPARAATGSLGDLGWDELEAAVAQWAAARRRKAVFGTGDRRAQWLCIGEPPAEEEERQGLPFTGDAGKLLDNMLAAVGASRQRGAYLASALKARLPEDRSREAEDTAQSLAFLQRQVELLQPRVILAMGRFPVQMLLQPTEPLGKLRGRVHRFGDVPVVVTYHPAYLLRTPADKARAWADLCLAQSLVRGDA